MSPNPFPVVSPQPCQGRSILQTRCLPLKSMQSAALSTSPTLHGLLMGQHLTKPVDEESMKKAKLPKTRMVSNASDVAAEALRITRESIVKGDSSSLAELRPNGEIPKSPPSRPTPSGGGTRLNKFVRRLHDMLQAEKDGGIIEWRRGLLVLHSTADFAKTILPKFFNTRNFKTFRRQLNYYGFVHVRSFSTATASTTALWVNQELAESGSADIGAVLTLKRVEPCELQKTAEGRRQRKEMAMHTVEEDLKIDPKTLQLEQIQYLARKELTSSSSPLHHHHVGAPTPRLDSNLLPSIPLEIAFRKTGYSSQQQESREQQDSSDNVVSDDTQSAASSSVDHHQYDAVPDDSMGAANLLLLLSRAGC